jgi:uncharacterized protein
MKLYEGRKSAQNVVRSYGADGVTLMASEERHPLPLLLTATYLDAGLEGRSLDALTERDLATIEAQAPDLVLVGAAAEPPRVPPKLRLRLESRRIAIEAMQLGAACRTFNVLVQEGRRATAALLL